MHAVRGVSGDVEVGGAAVRLEDRLESAVVVLVEASGAPEIWAVGPPPEARVGSDALADPRSRHDEVLSTEARVAMALAGISAALTFTQVAFQRGYDGFVLLAPFVGGATAYELGERFGYHGDPVPALKTIAIGALPGAALMGLGVAMAPNGGGEDGLPPAAAATFISGYVLYLVIPPILVARAHHPTVTPEVQATPDGGLAPGLSLTIGL